MTESDINQKVDSVFHETGLISIPVEVISMASFYGFTVYSLDMDSAISGIMVVDDKEIKNFNANKIIVVNAKHSPARKKFTIAHELGHYILNDKPTQCYAHRDIRGSYNLEEKNANSFASALLMPEEDVRRFVRSSNEDLANVYRLIFSMAKRYAVSESAAEVRLKKLQLI